MHVIVSDSLKDTFTQFKVVNSLKVALEDASISEIDVLVYHKTGEMDLNAGVWFSKFRSKYPEATVLYICSNPVQAMQMAIHGAKGFYYADEFYLHDEEELLSLVASHKEGTVQVENELAVVNSSLDIVSDFMQAFLQKEPRVNIKGYQDQVSAAINDLVVYTDEQNKQIQSMGNTALTIFGQAETVITTLRKNSDLLKSQLSKLEEHGPISVAGSTAGFSNAATSFPTYRFIGNAKVLCFREWAPTRYLTSFVLAYMRYLHLTKHKRVKLVFVYLRSNGIAKKYDKMTSIVPENYTRDNLYDADTIATNNPKREVMDKLLNRPNNDIVLVVDRLYGNDCIVTGRVKTVGVVSSRSDFDRYAAKPEDCFTSVLEYPGCLFTIPTLDRFPIDEDTRYAIYLGQFGTYFAKLDKILGIGG